jgi:hypothetical protein
MRATSVEEVASLALGMLGDGGRRRRCRYQRKWCIWATDDLHLAVQLLPLGVNHGRGKRGLRVCTIQL